MRLLFPTLAVGCEVLNSTYPSPRPELFSYAWSAQPQSVPEVPNSSVSLEYPTPECPWSAHPQSISTQRVWGCSKQNNIRVIGLYMGLQATWFSNHRENSREVHSQDVSYNAKIRSVPNSCSLPSACAKTLDYTDNAPLDPCCNIRG